MKLQRILLVVFISICFGCCYVFTGRQYDPLGRYPYGTEAQRERIRNCISKQDIQFIIDEDILPETFMPFMDNKEFDMTLCREYYAVAECKPEQSAASVVSFVNQVCGQMGSALMLQYLEEYDFQALIDWVNYKDQYVKNGKLLLHPDSLDATLDDITGVGRYVPDDLVKVDGISTPISGETVKLREEANENLTNMCKLLTDTFSSKCGGLIGVQGYMSFENQAKTYDEQLMEYGPDEVSKVFRYPGHNEVQLGMTIRFSLAKNEEQLENSEVFRWLVENAHTFGYVLRYPEEKEDVSRHVFDATQWRYVGTELATYLKQHNLCLEEYHSIK
ncbi:MAG: M15 family metallopeptidase [Erysipelotrichaceae bacterium]|nr:M15 family metallopeptidase [Erysipelotrichaceae bacterium]